MNRKDFLRGLGVAGLGLALPVEKNLARTKSTFGLDGVTCVLIPSETRGPYPLNLSGNANMFRQAINENKTGLPLNLTLTIVNVNDNCNPMANVRVDVWHCDKDGVYSGFNQPGANTVGQTFCRGIQMTDSNGEVHFTTVYPGWYPGRITHIHFEMYINSVLNATSQLAFPDSINAAVYATPLYVAHGQNTSVANNNADMVFSDGVEHQLATITPNSTTGGYDASLTVGIAAPVTGIINLEPETGGQFKLKQNYPNPHQGKTTVPFFLTNPADVNLELWDLTGKKVAQIVQDDLGEGEHEILLDLKGMGLPAGNYVYQLQVSNNYGAFQQCKLMTWQ